MKIYGYVDRGPNKIECEDRVLIGDNILADGYLEKEVDKNQNILIAVADGVGGNKGGACASSMAIDGIRILNRRESLVVPDIKIAIENINNNILNSSIQTPSLSNMATTLSGLVMNEHNTVLFHVGNTRIYTYKQPYLRKRTQDNTTINTLLQSGSITPEEANSSSIKNELDACLGGGNTRYASKLLVEDGERITNNADLILLCSDGVHDFIPLEQLEQLLGKKKSAKEICIDVVLKARENGSKDDISIIIYDLIDQF